MESELRVVHRSESLTGILAFRDFRSLPRRLATPLPPLPSFALLPVVRRFAIKPEIWRWDGDNDDDADYTVIVVASWITLVEIYSAVWSIQNGTKGFDVIWKLFPKCKPFPFDTIHVSILSGSSFHLIWKLSLDWYPNQMENCFHFGNIFPNQLETYFHFGYFLQGSILHFQNWRGWAEKEIELATKNITTMFLNFVQVCASTFL